MAVIEADGAGRGTADETHGPGRRAAAGAPDLAAGAPAAGGHGALNPYRWIILVGLIASVIMEALDSTIINVALPRMGGNLGATPNEIGWVSTGYILSVVVIVPLTAWLASRFGRKRYLVASILLFTAASFFCGVSRSLGALVFWRVIQGVGGGALLSTAQATLLEIFPQEQQGMVQGLFGFGVVVAPAVAPLLGGWITDNYDWPWVFFVNLPVGAAAAALIGTYLQDSRFRQRSADSVDVSGIALLATGLASLQYVLEEGQKDDWFGSVLITRLAVVSGVCLAAFVAWELSPRNHRPVVNLRVLRNRNLLAGVLLALALGFGLLGGLFIFPLFVQGILGFTATETGWVLLPAGLAILAGIVVCSSAVQRGADPRLLIVVGVATFIAANWELGHQSPQSDARSVLLGQVLRGVGIGFLFIPISVTAYATLEGEAIAQGTSLWNLSLQLGGAFGIAVLNTYVANMTQFHRVTLIGYLTQASAAVTARLDGLTGALTAGGYGAPEAHRAALGILERTVQAQAQTQAYNDAFLLIGVCYLFLFPILPLMRRPRPGAAPAALR